MNDKEQFEPFYDDVKITGENTAYVSIPKNITNALNIKKGDRVRVLIKKIESLGVPTRQDAE